MMDYQACNVVYLDQSILQDTAIEKGTPNLGDITNDLRTHETVLTFLRTFTRVHLCSTGVSCLNKVRELETVVSSCTPTLIFIEAGLPSDEEDSTAENLESSQDPTSADNEKHRQDSGATGDFSGLALIKHLKADIERHNLSKLAVPVAISPKWQPSDKADDCDLMMKCVEAGAADVIIGLLTESRLRTLSVHAHRARLEGLKEKPEFLEQRRMRKRSWVGVDEEKPYAYLRESMVSTLMESICKPHSAIGAVSSANTYTIKPAREAEIRRAIARWNFSAHSFSDDELLHAAYLMLQHALSMKELEKWRISSYELRNFLLASRSAYNSFVLYHNFRHVVDVLQAVFYFLLQIGTLPPHPASESGSSEALEKSPIAALLTPFDALVLLIAAVGHDVGHPGVNNAFLVKLKAPLAQLYNDNSVLEAFHCAAYSQILRRYWSVTDDDTDVRQLLIKCILATDMQIHFKYMADLGNLQEKLAHNKGTDGWNPQQLDEYKVLTCGLLIKCADISNVARPFEIAARWADILQQEFSRQGEMERNVGIPTTLFGGPPELGNLEKLAQSQIGFINVFAYPLFEAVADILPGMKFGIEEIKSNQAIWKQKKELAKASNDAANRLDRSEGFQSPRSGSPDRMFIASSPESSHPEGIPATGYSPTAPIHVSVNTLYATPDIGSPVAGNVGQAISTPNVLPSQTDRKASFGLPVIPTDPFDGGETSNGSFDFFQNVGAAGATGGALNRPTASQPHLGTAASNSSTRTASALENVPFEQAPSPKAPSTPTSGPRQPLGEGPPTPSNFSRPISMRANHSHTRSSAPSNVPTVPSSAVPTSPTETQATSLMTDGSDIAHDSVDLDRPGSGTSSALGTSTTSSRSPGRATIIKATPPGNSAENRANGHMEERPPLRKKPSRFRLDFWNKKKRSLEATSP